MAQSYITESGSTIFVPGTYVSTQVKSSASAPITIGVVTLIGEAEEGPDFTQESDLSNVAFGPDQIGDVIAKFGSGKLVDGFRGLVTASNDPAITGAPQLIRLVKTNKSIQAQIELARSGFGAYSTVKAKKHGLNGNLIKYKAVPATSEIAPQALNLCYAPAYDTAKTFSLRVNGGDIEPVTCDTLMSGEDFVAAMTSYSKGILATGGQQKLPLAGLGGSASLTASLVPSFTDRLQITIQAGYIFSTAPVVGETVIIPDANFGSSTVSCIKGSGAVDNSGAFAVVEVTNTASNASLILKKLSGTGTLGSATGIIDVSEDDIILFKNISLHNKSGQDRLVLNGLQGTFTTTLNDGVNVKLTCPALLAQPFAGDTVIFPATFAGINAGFYQATASTSNSITLIRLSNGSAGTTGTANLLLTDPRPFQALKPTIDGLGKTLEIHGSVESILKDNATFAGANLSNKVLVSSAEQKMSVSITKGNAGKTVTVGGDIVLQVACTAQNSSMVIGDTKIDFYSNSVLKFSATFKQFKTCQDLVDLISSKSGFSAKLQSAKYGSFSTALLDKGTFGISASSASYKTALIKADANAFATIESDLASFSKPVTGLPEMINPAIFLEGGEKGSTTGAEIVEAIDACEYLETNFIASCFDVDADTDIFAGETESGSTYTIDAINAYLASHSAKMSTEKMKKNRIAIGAKKASFVDSKEAANDIANFRFGLCFQPALSVDSTGSIKEFGPWMMAVKAAGMSAAAGYKGIVKKFVGINGIGKVDGFNAISLAQLEDALKSGLLVAESVATGGFRWVSDQTTYSVDNNFVYNSLQAVYLADLIALALIARFDRAITGKSVAEISAATALSILDAEMYNFLRLKWIAPSDDAVMGYKDAVVKLKGGVMAISVAVKIAGLIYFIPVNLTVEQVEQTVQ